MADSRQYYHQNDPFYHSIYRQYAGMDQRSVNVDHHHYHYQPRNFNNFNNIPNDGRLNHYNNNNLINVRLKLAGQRDDNSVFVSIYDGIPIQELSIIIRRTFSVPSNYFIIGISVPVSIIQKHQQQLEQQQQQQRNSMISPRSSSSIKRRSSSNNKANSIVKSQRSTRSTRNIRGSRNNRRKLSDNDINDPSNNELSGSNDDSDHISNIRNRNRNINENDNDNDNDIGDGNENENDNSGDYERESTASVRSQSLINYNETTIIPLSYLSANPHLFEGINIALTVILDHPIPVLGYQLWITWCKNNWQAILLFVSLIILTIYIIDLFSLYPWHLLFWLWHNVINPWSKHMYRYGPYIPLPGMSIGFWQGKDLPDICSHWSSQSAEFWARNMDECNKMYERAEYAFSATVAALIAILLMFKYIGTIATVLWEAVLECCNMSVGRSSRSGGRGQSGRPRRGRR